MSSDLTRRRRAFARSVRYEIAVASTISLLALAVTLALARAESSAVSEQNDTGLAVKANG